MSSQNPNLIASQPTLIYAPLPSASYASPLERIWSGVIAACCLAVLLIAAKLPPSHDGTATHTQLGLARCGMMERYGLPCPTCGMTTSFAWFVRGNLLASLWVQPMGCVIAILSCAAVWIGGYIAIVGRPVHRVFDLLPGRYWLVPSLSLFVLAWGWKMWIVLHKIDGWR